MKKIFILIIFLLLFMQIKSLSMELFEPDKYFDVYDTGCFVLYDMEKDIYIVYNREQAQKRLSPCSSFKIYNSMIGLETGVIENEDSVIPWDGTHYDFIEEWNRDHTLKSAMKYSVVWYYKELARRVGEEKMQEFINKLDYGNRDISGGIDNFWLRSSLKISALEQVELLKKLLSYDLPCSKRTIDILKNILALDITSNYILSGKTGSAFENEKWTVGWFVGYVTSEGHTYVFATNIEGEGARGEEAKKITYEILRDLTIIK